jgi:hypothetical protein
MSLELPDVRHDPDWPTAVHEAGHAVVGMAVGGQLRALIGIPPRACIEYKPGVSRRALLAAAVAGPAAQRIAENRDPAEALGTSLEQFFELLGGESIDSFRADGLASGAEEDDLDVVVPLIESYTSRQRGLAQFRHGRAQAVRTLRKRWDEVEKLALPIMVQLRAGGD